MPLRIICKGCGRALLLDDAFQGAHCRCRHCRRLLAVPRLPNTASTRSAARPRFPSSIVARKTVAPRRAKPGPARPPARPKHPVLARITTFRAVAAACFAGVATLGVAVWIASGTPAGPGEFAPLAWLQPSGPDGAAQPAQDVRSVVLAADPKTAYFGIPLAGGTIAYVVDCDATMVDYIDQVAYLTGHVNRSLEPGSRRFGIVQATSDPDGRRLMRVYNPTTDLVDATTVLQSELAGGTTDLPKALAVTEPWYADQIFLVLSKRVEASDLELLIQNAQQSGAATNVIALGEAAAQVDELSKISDATGGRFMPISDALIEDLVEHCQDQFPDESR